MLPLHHYPRSLILLPLSLSLSSSTFSAFSSADLFHLFSLSVFTILISLALASTTFHIYLNTLPSLPLYFSNQSQNYDGQAMVFFR